MRNFAFLVLILITNFVFAQSVDPLLFGTWLLESIQESDASPIYIISEIEPEIDSHLIISENHGFSGIGACNYFEGVFDIQSDGVIETIEFNSISEDCSITLHNDFENAYFGFLQSIVHYSLTTDNDDIILSFGGSVFGQAIYRKVVMSATKTEINPILVYPNPASDFIMIQAAMNIQRIHILNTQNQMVARIEYPMGNVNISYLQSGIYFLKIDTVNGFFTIKISKN